MSASRDTVEIIVAFFVAWLFYNALAFATGTQLPIVSVVSESMVHTPGFGNWWNASSQFYESKGISMERFASFRFPNGLSKGDLLLVLNTEPQVGDIIIYNTGSSGITIVHRVVEKRDGGYILKGDNNQAPDPGIVRKDQIIGKVMFGAPLLGYPRLALYAVGI